MTKRPAPVAVAVLAAATVAALTGLGLIAARDSPNTGITPDIVTVSGTPSATDQAQDRQPAKAPDLFAGVSVLLLGDSLAAGEGGGQYLTGTDEPHQRCHRSAAGWFAGTAAKITNLACSRAIIGSLTAPQSHPDHNARPEPPQLHAAAGRPRTLTLVMLGGNDIGFAAIFNQCVLADADCAWDPAFTGGAIRSAGQLSASLSEAYRTVADHVGGSTVLVPAYPQLFGAATADCGRISPAEADFGKELTAALNRSVREGAEDAAQTYPAIHFVPTTETALAGHGACDPDPYVHTVLPTALLGAVQAPSAAQELLHPTAAGYGRLTEALRGWLADNPAIVTTTP